MLFIKQNTNIFIVVIIILLVALFIPNNFIAKLINDCPSGCLHNQVCLPIGTRTQDKYCDSDNTLKNQLSTDVVCTNNYECQTNICIDKCQSYSTLKESYCRSREELGYETYEECIK